MRSADVIKRVAGLVDARHKVNLTKPDKVILLDIFQVCPPFLLLTCLYTTLLL